MASQDRSQRDTAGSDLYALARLARARDRRIAEAFARRGREPWPSFDVLRGGLCGSAADRTGPHRAAEGPVR
jgi:hypothetical protein